MTVQIRMNPNFKADVLKAAEEKLGVKITPIEERIAALREEGQAIHSEADTEDRPFTEAEDIRLQETKIHIESLERRLRGESF